MSDFMQIRVTRSYCRLKCLSQFTYTRSLNLSLFILEFVMSRRDKKRDRVLVDSKKQQQL
jgi:hypothetical protein